MHLPALNLPDLFIPLWRGSFTCEATDDVANWPWAVLRDSKIWKEHGKQVADTRPYIPGSFDRPPRNPAEKISSGYKAWEFLLYFFGLGPALFYNLLPDEYWMHYCKCVRGVRILLQEEIFPAEVAEAHKLLTEFSDDFERLYVQRRTDRIHFVRPSIHTASHFAPETVRVGPGIIYSQWGMERTIGNLGEEIKQHSNAFANLAQRGIRRCQVNALKAMIPDIEPPENPLPRGAKDLGGGYAFLTAMDTTSRPVRECEASAIVTYLHDHGKTLAPDMVSIIRWSRLRLPNGQIARSKWKESLKTLDKLRTSRCVKFEVDGSSYIGEVLFYMLLRINDTVPAKPVALVSLYGPPHPGLLAASSNTFWTAQHRRDAAIRVIDINSIKSALTMAPDERYKTRFHDGTETDRWYVMEKPGLKLSERVGLEELLTEED
ncbi:hypothetical protein C8F04DRAFT_1091397 [Mycena alexandri]|uniref:Uncharacterized protein n=1 Tax=Mycena alexandri TaxID=1745969 RepID=A0AAD6T1Q3_9AGAR|nr:hypothetical protein C8F04DRAFT_1091397 [Mycena alexandri]